MALRPPWILARAGEPAYSWLPLTQTGPAAVISTWANHPGDRISAQETVPNESLASRKRRIGKKVPRAISTQLQRVMKSPQLLQNCFTGSATKPEVLQRPCLLLLQDSRTRSKCFRRLGKNSRFSRHEQLQRIWQFTSQFGLPRYH